MRPDLNYYVDKENILSNLKEIDFISKFILYDRFNRPKKKLRKKLKKLISQVENDQVEEYLESDVLNDD